MKVAFAWIAVAAAGCSSLLGIDDLRLADDARPADGPGDGTSASCVGGGLLRVCPASSPTSQLLVDRALELDTADAACLTMTSGTTEVCVMVHASIEVTAGATLRATGPRPLVLASMSSISILGALDASSVLGKPPGAGAEPKACPPTLIPASGDGGAGGSFGGRGGDGGNGGAVAPPPVAALTEIRGGCAGSRGGGSQNQALGAGGGAVYLIARDRIVVDGRVNASGAGGDAGGSGGGGNGGGAGGLIGLDAPEITGAGMLFANGGGGGGGTIPFLPSSPGAESPEAKVAGVGGNGDGNGGDGGLGSQIDGLRGGNGQGAGGGGGGAVGIIYARGNLTVTGAISPTPTRPTTPLPPGQ